MVHSDRELLPRVLIDGQGDVWVRDWQDGVDVYWQVEGGYTEARSERCTYAVDGYPSRSPMNRPR